PAQERADVAGVGLSGEVVVVECASLRPRPLFRNLLRGRGLRRVLVDCMRTGQRRSEINSFALGCNQWPSCMFLRSHPVKTFRKNPMLKGLAGLLTVVFVAGSVYAQEASHARPNPTAFNILTDARIGLAKAVLQLTPEQARFWPPVEEAIRSRAVARMD